MDVPDVSPRLRSLVDICGAGVKPECYELCPISVHDCHDPDFITWFEPESAVAYILEHSKSYSAHAPGPSGSASSSVDGSSSSHSFAAGRTSSFESVAFKRPKKVAAKPYENAYILEQEFSSQSAEKSALESWAHEIFGQMDDACKERFLRGRSSMSASVHDSLVLAAVERTAQKDQ